MDEPEPQRRPRRRVVRRRAELPPAADIPLPPPEGYDEIWPRWIVASLVASGLISLVLIALIASPGTFGLAPEERLERVEARERALSRRVEALEARVSADQPAAAPATGATVEARLAALESGLAGTARDLASLRTAASALCGATPAAGC